MAYVSISDTGLGAPQVAFGGIRGVTGFWANSDTQVVVYGNSRQRPSTAANWSFHLTRDLALAWLKAQTISVPPPITPPRPPVVPVKPPTPYQPPVVVQPPIKPPIPFQPPNGVAADYRYEGNVAYPLNSRAATVPPQPLTRTADFKWLRKYSSQSAFGYVWEWKYVPPPESLVIGAPTVAVPPSSAGATVDVGGVIQPVGDANVFPISLSTSPAEYYNKTTGIVAIGRRLQRGGTWFSFPPDDSGNWLIRSEAVRQGYVSATGNAGIQDTAQQPVGAYLPTGVDTPAPEPQQAGMNPWLIGGLALAALALFSGKGARS